MKRFLVLAFALALVFIAALAGASAARSLPAQANAASEVTVPPVDQPQWASYVDDRYGFAVEYPGTWTVSIPLTNDGRDPGIIERRTLFSAGRSVGVNIDIFSNEAGVGLEEWFDGYQARYVIPDGPVQRGLLIAGEPAIYSVESAEGPLPPRHTVVLRHGGYVFRIEYQANDGGGYLTTYRTMLESLSFFGGPDPADSLPDTAGTAPSQGPVMIDDQDCCGYVDPHYNPYPCYDGNCVWWARFKRPDTGGQGYPYWGNAQYWTSRAAEEGFVVDTTPETGAVAGTPRSGNPRRYWEHHVAYVEHFNGNVASFSDMDYGDFDCHVDTWSMSEWAGIEFIHSQEVSCPQSGGVILYWNYYYNCDNGQGDAGYRQRTFPGWENVTGAFDDNASSLKVPAGWSVKLYADVDRAGASTCRNADDVDFTWNYFDGGKVLLNDDVSSFEVFDVSDCGSGLEYPVVLWEAADYLGMDCTLLNEGWANACDGFNDAASSVDLLDGWSSRVYKDTDRAGTSLCLTEDDPDFSDHTFEDGSPLDEQISSFEAFHNTSCTPPCGPPAPDLASPANGAALYPEDDVVFSWSGAATEYQVHWWGGPGEDAYSEWISSTLWITGTQDESPDAYYWQVKGRDEPGCEGPWSPAWEYRVGPGAPTDLTAGTVSCSQIDLAWQDNSTTESDYAIERSLDGADWSQIATISGTSYQDTGLNGETTYYYQVRAHRQSDDTYSRYSNTTTATTLGGQPGTPSLLLPSDGSHTCDATPRFDWSTVGGATSYNLQVDNSSDFASPEIDLTTTDSEHTPETPLAPDTYYWRVHSTNDCGNGSWSSVWSVAVLGIPSAPNLLSPPDGALRCNTTPTFEWSAVPEAAYYRIQVDNNSDFSSPEIIADGMRSYYTPSRPLAPDAYYWRVRASGTCGHSEWSIVRSLSLADGCHYSYLPGICLEW
jgi:surface antigen